MRRIAIIGVGMGTPGSMTVEAAEFCRGAQLLIGAQRMLGAVEEKEGQIRCVEYLPDKVSACIQAHPEAEQAAILLSGDVGFFSGAKKLLDAFPDAVVFSGISSAVCFAGRLKMSWEDWKLTSSHGRKCNLIGEILRNRKVFTILGTKDAAAEICRKLVWYEMQGIRVWIGENLGYPEEQILSGTPADFAEHAGTALSVMLIENPDPRKIVTHGIADEEFLRDKVPMTKEEVREISVSKLHLAEDSVAYDIGAGSGSVSVEMALMAVQGMVYAIEKNPNAVELLHKNKRKFRVDNMEIVEGLAPEAMKDLPAPTHAFIGGSSGNMKEILDVLVAKNPNVRVVVNAITLETVDEALGLLSRPPFAGLDTVSVSAAKSKTVGRYHMMMGQNPVYIFSADAVNEEDDVSK